MIDLLLLIICVFALLLLFFRRWSLMEKGHLFGRMVFKRGHSAPKPMTKEDHEVTTKEMIPDQSKVHPKLIVKGDNLFKKAEQEFKKGNITDAEKHYIKAIAMNPAHLEAHAKLGAIYLNQEQFSKAELIYSTLVLAVADNPVYFSNLGLSLFQQEKYEEAKDFYEKAIALDSGRPGRFYSLARINQLLGDMDNAFLNVQKALNLDPDNLDYGLTLANWYVENGLNAEAKGILENIIQHWPENAEAKDLMKEIGG